MNISLAMCFRPLSGSFFLYICFSERICSQENVSVPYRGLSFYMDFKMFYPIELNKEFPSPIGVFLFILMSIKPMRLLLNVSVPYRGLSFYIGEDKMKKSSIGRFPSPIGVFLFILRASGLNATKGLVSVPYRGLSFYIETYPIVFLTAILSFPSPIGVFLFISCPLYPSVCNT